MEHWSVNNFICSINTLITGQKFPTKSLELFLQASVHFNEVIPLVPEGMTQDPFCVGLNSYAEVSNTVFCFKKIRVKYFCMICKN